MQPYLPVLHVGSLVRNLFPVFQPHYSASDKRKQAQSETWEVLSEHKETSFYWESDWPLEQVVQRHCGMSIPGDIQKLYGHGPGKQGISAGH